MVTAIKLLQNLKIKTTVLQRLGYLLDLTGNQTLGEIVHYYFLDRKPINYIWLVPGESLDILEKNDRWKININEEVELDI